jgi:hypothetical protein
MALIMLIPLPIPPATDYLLDILRGEAREPRSVTIAEKIAASLACMKLSISTSFR